MRIAIVHNAVKDESSPDERDVLVQTQAVSDALKSLGHEPFFLACTLDLSAIKRQTDEIRPDAVFNLVESLDGHGRLIHLFPTLLDAMKIPYTGSCAQAILVTSNKIMAKERMAALNLPTPPWVGPYPQDMPGIYSQLQKRNFCTPECKTILNKIGIFAPEAGWIIKSLWEHASIGLDEDIPIRGKSVSEIEELLKSRASRLGGACFGELFIEGREFNLALLAGPDGPEVLPPAEIVFEGYEEGRPRIVGYRAKWEEDSYEYNHTIRSFDFPPEDTALLSELKAAALRCWQMFGLGGYARVDFRVDAGGQIWILEINTNPCLSPDAGYAAAVCQSGLSFADAVQRIIIGVRGQR
jgi:D-alanine-D-alanine ligase